MDTILWYYFIVFLLFFGISFFRNKFTYKNPKILVISIASTWTLLSGLSVFFVVCEFVSFYGVNSSGILPMEFLIFYGCFSYVAIMLVRNLKYNFNSVKLNKQASSYVFISIMTLLCILMLLNYSILFSSIILFLNIFTLGYIYNKKPHIFQRSFLAFLIMLLLFVVVPHFIEAAPSYQVIAPTAFNFHFLGYSIEWIFMLLFAFHFILIWNFKKSEGY